MKRAAVKVGTMAVAALTIAACGQDRAEQTEQQLPSEPASAGVVEEPSTDWQLDVSDRGGARLLFPASAVREGQDPVLVLTCIGDRLIVRLPRVAPVPSEERLSIGSGDSVFAMVADAQGVGSSASARGAMPEELSQLLGDGFAASYGDYSLGRLPPLPEDMSARWRSACA